MGGGLERLKRRSEFLRVAAGRRKWAAPGLVLQAAPAISAPPPAKHDEGIRGAPLPPTPSEESAAPTLRVGFTCSKKVGNAVARNRARRRLRAAAAQILAAEAAPGFDYVLIGRQETLHRPFALLLQDLQTALKRVGAIRKGDGAAGPETGRPIGREGS